MSRTNYVTPKVVDPVSPSKIWAYDIIVPPDGAAHPLNEIGFGYYVAPTVAGSDRAIRSVSIQNRADQDPAGVSIFVGSPASALPLPWEISPGVYYTFAIDKLSEIAIANHNTVPVTATIWLTMTTSA